MASLWKLLTMISSGSIAVTANVGTKLILPQNTNQNPQIPSLLRLMGQKLVLQQTWQLGVPRLEIWPSHHRYQNPPPGKALL